MSYVTIAERLYTQRGLEQGLERGLEQGLEQGRVKGQADLLLRQVQRRFGAVDADVVQRIHSASMDELETWSLNILDAATLDDVFRD